jgi:hypothetical protein
MRTPEEIAEELFGQSISANAGVDLLLSTFKTAVADALRAYGSQERERCARVADAERERWGYSFAKDPATLAQAKGARFSCSNIAATIRALPND